MSAHLKRSRVTKALADAGLAPSFDAAEARLDAVHVSVVTDQHQTQTPAGQAAILTALATALKSFGRASFVCTDPGARLLGAHALGLTLLDAARTLGASWTPVSPACTTHAIYVGAGDGEHQTHAPWGIYCWWDRWCAGARTGPVATGDDRVALAGVFSGAFAVRQVFAHIRFGRAAPPRAATLSLWCPELGGDAEYDAAARGPTRFTAPSALWFLGLGHLGQAAIWALCLATEGEGRAIVQDDQKIGEENEATSLLVRADDIGVRKARVAANWLERSNWTTAVIERRHCGDIALRPEDPPFLLAGLDELTPRLAMANAGHDYMVDVGVGHGARDFESLQIRVIPKGASVEALWQKAEPAILQDRLLNDPAYQALDRKVGVCGAHAIANASVAVPFVGACAAALALAQITRLVSGEDAVALLQVDLAAPDMIIDGGRIGPPQSFLGGAHINLDDVSEMQQTSVRRESPDSS